MLLIKSLLAFRPNKMDWIFATKTFVAGILALYVALSLDLAYPIWAIGTVFVIANPYTGMTASKSIYRVLGTLLGAIVAVAVTPWLINTPWLFTLFLSCWVGLCLYFSLLDRTPRSYILMLAGYTTVIICFNIIYFIDTASLFDMAVGRFLEITIGVVCSAIVTTTIFPMHIGPAVKSRVSKTLADTQQIFNKILLEPRQDQNYTKALSQLAADIADIHVMAVHLSYEKSALQGMTKPLQEMLNQITMLVSNLVAMSERMQQLDFIDTGYRQSLADLHSKINAYLTDEHLLKESELNQLPTDFEADFLKIFEHSKDDQIVILKSLKMDIRHFIQNIHAIKLIWQRIQQGDNSLPEMIVPLTTNYPTLHRDHGVAVRGGVSACLTVFIATTFWILSGWKAGFMLAEMAAISACILTALDNPVPALKLFIRSSLYASVVIFIYAYGIFPNIIEFWQLALVLAPFCIYCLMLFLHPPLVGIGLPLLMGAIMGLNFQNRYTLNQISFFDAAIGTVIGPIIAVFIIHMIRAMSPDITVQRILAIHNRAIRQALYIPYGVRFRIHLRTMIDRIGVLNTKAVESEDLKNKINQALIESSAVVDLARLQELILKLPEQQPLTQQLEDLQIQLDEYFRAKEIGQNYDATFTQLINKIQALEADLIMQEHTDVVERLHISLNNIRSSLCHIKTPPRYAGAGD
ncbi:FUSC family protein [Acinetobacter variabilis]|uniref:FUSC family protein n=1 Tax=Acinetobacter variabilis TaxID=70346 RepID=UPI003D76783A